MTTILETPETSNASDCSPLAAVRSSADDLPVMIYSPESPLRHPVRLVRQIFVDIWRCRELVWILFTRDLKAAYRQSYLGYFWIFAPILGTTVVWWFLNSQRVIQVAETPIPYPAFVLIGTLLWNVFTSSLTKPLEAFNAGAPVFMKLKVPPEAFLMAGLGRVFFNLLIQLLVLIPVFLSLRIVPAWTAFLFPLGLLCLMLSGIAIGLLLVPLGSLYTDIRAIVGMSLPFLMYLTPVVYPPPESGFAAVLMRWNPVAPFIIGSRDWLTLGHSPEVLPMLIMTLASVALLLIGLVVLRVTMPHLVVRMGM